MSRTWSELLGDELGDVGRLHGLAAGEDVDRGVAVLGPRVNREMRFGYAQSLLLF